MKATIINLKRPDISPIYAQYCASFGCQLRGLTFKSSLDVNEGLLLVQKHDSIINAAIHMLFMRIEISVIWINEEGVVVDTCLARPWRLAYVPSKPAKYILETHPVRIDDFLVGEYVQIIV